MNWRELEDQLLAACEETLVAISARHPAETFYGLVIELGQNWEVELYLNTEVGLEGGVAAFRKNSRCYEAISDGEIAEMMGRWYFQCWKYNYLSLVIGGRLAELNRKNYQKFEQLFEEADLLGNTDDILRGFLCSAFNAAVRLKSSDVVLRMNRSQDFAAEIVDDDGLKYVTKEHL